MNPSRSMFYRPSIIVFGFVLPLGLCAALLGGGFLAKSKAQAAFAEKQSLYASSERERIGALGMEAQIAKKRPFLVSWEDKLEKKQGNSITSQLKQISETLPAKEFQLTGEDYPQSKTGFASATTQPSSQVSLSFRGTFRSAQKALATLESRMPQLQLNEMKIDPSGNSNSSLNFQVSYTSWEK